MWRLFKEAFTFFYYAFNIDDFSNNFLCIDLIFYQYQES